MGAFDVASANMSLLVLAVGFVALSLFSARAWMVRCACGASRGGKTGHQVTSPSSFGAISSNFIACRKLNCILLWYLAAETAP